MGEFERVYPGISVALRIANSRAIEEQIRANELDLGVVGAHAPRAGEKCLAATLPDELVLIVPPTHPWAGRRRLDASRLSQERVLMREEGSATRQVMERALQRASVGIGRTLELGHTEAIKQAVMAGLGVAFVSIYAVRGELETGRLRRVRLQGVRILRHFHVIHNEARNLTARAQAFVDAIQRFGRRALDGQPALGGGEALRRARVNRPARQSFTPSQRDATGYSVRRQTGRNQGRLTSK